ncbi:MAG: hypothetical protein QOH26_564 [Actinomycetota bacterium]|nr:hypothetical protein [Actinomycetota bacterium]
MTKWYYSGVVVDADKPPLSGRDPLEPEPRPPTLRQRFLMAVLFLSLVGLAFLVPRLL